VDAPLINKLKKKRSVLEIEGKKNKKEDKKQPQQGSAERRRSEELNSQINCLQ